MNTTKKTILFLFGGESSEHDVSILSARNVFAALDAAKVTPVLCYIDPRGGWWHVSTIARQHEHKERVTPLLGASAVEIGERIVHIDVIFPVLHGTHGEDGEVQGLASLLHTPIVGCGVDGSLLCMDKTLAKQLLAGAGIPVVPGEWHTADRPPAFADVVRRLGPVLFVKPARQGSSVGVGKASTEAEFIAAFREAGSYGKVVLVESAIQSARELEVALLGPAASPKASGVGEVVPDADFYSYESKYADTSTSKIIIPAAIDPDVSAKIQKIAKEAYALLRCRGLARIDFFLTPTGELYVNEVNTLPGFTNISMYPKLWEASGLSNQALVMTLIDQAV